MAAAAWERGRNGPAARHSPASQGARPLGRATYGGTRLPEVLRSQRAFWPYGRNAVRPNLPLYGEAAVRRTPRSGLQSAGRSPSEQL